MNSASTVSLAEREGNMRSGDGEEEKRLEAHSSPIQSNIRSVLWENLVERYIFCTYTVGYRAFIVVRYVLTHRDTSSCLPNPFVDKTSPPS